MSAMRLRPAAPSRPVSWRLLSACIAIACVGSAAAQVEFFATSLHPTGLSRSVAKGTAGSIQAGYVQGATTIPTIWRGTPESATLLDARPYGWVEASINSTSETYQVGRGLIGDVSYTTHAITWQGTPESIRDINPAGFRSSWADEISGDQIVGVAIKGASSIHAGLWRASDGAFTDLHPTGALSSGAGATDGVRQAGSASFSSWGSRGLIWNGSKDDYIDISPAGAFETGIQAMTADTQVGWARFDGNPVAGLWHNTAESFVRLAPPSAYYSTVEATTGSIHAGFVRLPIGDHAAAWISDSPDGFIDLQPSLGPGYFSSSATAISRTGDVVTIVGAATAINGTVEAVMWTAVIPAPGSVALVSFLGLVAARRRRGRGAGR
jgi:hypothetical protein